jgi:hypothetical protein
MFLLEAVICATQAFAGDCYHPVDSAECKEITARLLEATNAMFDRYGLTRSTIFLKHPNPIITDMVLSCGFPCSSSAAKNHHYTGIGLAFEGAFPPNGWFAVAAKAGRAVTGENIEVLDQGMRQCQREALKSETESADLETPNARIECQAFTHDGGRAAVDIWFLDEDILKPGK